MLNHITLHFGADQDAEPLKISLTPITIYVGPNNSGKSMALRELEEICVQGFRRQYKIIAKIEFKSWDTEDLIKLIDQVTVPPNPHESVQPDTVIVSTLRSSNGAHRQTLHLNEITRIATNPSSNLNYFCQAFIQLWITRLDAVNRIQLTNQQSGGDLLESPQNHLAFLIKDTGKRLEVRRIIREAFSKYFVIDPTQLGILRIRLSERDPVNEINELSLDMSAISFHKDALEIASSSDGVKAFTGMTMALLASHSRIVLIDEPEAFLHPPLAQRLGREISTIARNESKQIFAATHSSSFVMGCVQSGVPVNIIRLTYQDQVPTARLLDNNKLVKLMRNPLLRSTGVLNALFHEYVIVTEADGDRSFYQEINERLLHFNSTKGIPECLFLNAVGISTIWEIIKPLRELGIAAVAIVDIDVLDAANNDWTKILSAAFVPEGMKRSVYDLRSAVFAGFPDKAAMKKEGVKLLSSADQEVATHLFQSLAEYGIFVVEHGEMEGWLPQLKVDNGKHGPKWLSQAFERMGDDPQDSDYLRPSEGDVWDFIAKIKAWLSDLNRKGIPKSQTQTSIEAQG